MRSPAILNPEAWPEWTPGAHNDWDPDTADEMTAEDFALAPRYENGAVVRPGFPLVPDWPAREVALAVPEPVLERFALYGEHARAAMARALTVWAMRELGLKPPPHRPTDG